ncbi:hypothetical protein QO010_003925 [Caulobacter ginsengisoli]|uniref:Uncharacterized protein n=1 Tax=Caulobacter ginsengisoli TaxID=400775 RepID=A0ABU0IVV1_9CAUL|nr:hypothetical protein [Caulobacter ginsengisoli]MDQ0466132.1 hypothetical protein [Caulobacter ginsengisoli]
MPVWLLVLVNLIFDIHLIVALVTGRVPAARMLFSVKYADRRDNPAVYWFFTGLLFLICLFGGSMLAEATIPGFAVPALG